jgi:peptidoglycan/xylan/chitin deacetylase (PgdA/CDA1 family)
MVNKESITVPILMYHSISDETTPKSKEFTVAPKMFADHLSHLAQQGYTPLTVSQFVEALEHPYPVLPERPVVLTFDDGYADFYTNALPALLHHGFSATLYVATAYVGGTNRWLAAEGEARRPMLNWDQLTEIVAAGIECGAHSHTHPQLDILPVSVARAEIVQCKSFLEEHLNQRVSSFAYPYGYYTRSIREMVVAAGYSSACAVRYLMSSSVDDPFALARLIVSADTSLDDFSRLLTGYGSQASLTYRRARAFVWKSVRHGVAKVTSNFHAQRDMA